MKHVVHTVRSQGSTGDGIATAVIRKSVHDFTFLHHADSYGGLVVSFLPSNCFWNLSYSVIMAPKPAVSPLWVKYTP